MKKRGEIGYRDIEPATASRRRNIQNIHCISWDNLGNVFQPSTRSASVDFLLAFGKPSTQSLMIGTEGISVIIITFALWDQSAKIELETYGHLRK